MRGGRGDLHKGRSGLEPRVPIGQVERFSGRILLKESEPRGGDVLAIGVQAPIKLTERGMPRDAREDRDGEGGEKRSVRGEAVPEGLEVPAYLTTPTK